MELSYTDKFLTAIALEFRDKYKNVLELKNFLSNFSDFIPTIDKTFTIVKNEALIKPKKYVLLNNLFICKYQFAKIIIKFNVNIY